MTRLESSGFPDYRLDRDRLKTTEKFCAIFKDCRLSITSDMVSSVALEYELGVARKPVTFFGFTVDLSDGWIYLTRMGDIPSIKVGLISDLFSFFTGSLVSRDAALLAVEKFKLTGSFSKMFEMMDSSMEGSLISVSLHRVVRTSLTVREEKIKEFTNLYKGTMQMITDVYGFLMSHATEGTKLTAKRDLYMHRNYTKWSNTDFLRESDRLEECLYLGSTPAYWRDKYTLDSSVSKKRAQLASNTLEICDSMEGGEDVVLTTNVAGRLKKLGFDTILSSREMASITSNTSYIDTMKKSASVSASTTDKYGIAGKPMRYGDEGDKSASILRNSIKVLSKVVHKIMGTKDGDGDA